MGSLRQRLEDTLTLFISGPQSIATSGTAAAQSDQAQLGSQRRRQPPDISIETLLDPIRRTVGNGKDVNPH
jgi:hypothetical protein